MDNPLLRDWTANYGLPPFNEIKPEHFEPAAAVAQAAHLAELAAIAGNPDAATFDNTIAAYDAAGRQLGAVQMCFENLTSSETSPALQAVEQQLSPKFAAHRSAIYLNEKLFARIDGLYLRRNSLNLNGVALRLLERVHLDFALAGARLQGAARVRYAEIAQQLATLMTTFSQRVLADEANYLLVVQNEADLAGFPQWLRDTGKATAESRKVAGGYAFNASRSVVEAFLAFSKNRALREKILAAFRLRGRMDEAQTTLPVITQILTLRQEQARIMGYDNYSQYALADTMAQRPEAVNNLLSQVWPAAQRRATEEYAEIAPYAKADGIDTVQAWDWRYYAERLCEDKYAVSDAEVKPYFSIEAMTRAMFDCAGKLFGLRFTPVTGVPTYHPDVQVYEVRKGDSDALKAIFLTDNFARPSKRSGAWMSYFREQTKVNGNTIPIVVNTNNFPKPPTGQPALLGFGEVRTLFHEFGHGLHGMLSDSTYQRLGGTNVLQDFVELPSQLFEHWALAPQVLKAHAKHAETGLPIPDELIAKLKHANVVNQGLEAVEASASVLVDLNLHQRTDFSGLDLLAFEAETLRAIGLPAHMKPRHELAHFGHLFSGESYASKYYVYLWAEVLDADAYEAFSETGDPFNKPLAEKLYTHIYAAGNTAPPAETYRAFRGRDPKVEPMLRKKGLLAA